MSLPLLVIASLTGLQQLRPKQSMKMLSWEFLGKYPSLGELLDGIASLALDFFMSGNCYGILLSTHRANTKNCRSQMERMWISITSLR